MTEQNYVFTDSDEQEQAKNESYLKLSKILEKESGQPVSLKDAREIGQDLVELYKALAGKRRIVRGDIKINGRKDSNYLNR